MATQRMHAGPPDDGGEQGSFTQPVDAMTVLEPDSASSGTPPAAEGPQQMAKARGALLAWLALPIVFGLAVVWFSYCSGL